MVEGFTEHSGDARKAGAEREEIVELGRELVVNAQPAAEREFVIVCRGIGVFGADPRVLHLNEHRIERGGEGAAVGDVRSRRQHGRDGGRPRFAGEQGYEPIDRIRRAVVAAAQRDPSPTARGTYSPCTRQPENGAIPPAVERGAALVLRSSITRSLDVEDAWRGGCPGSPDRGWQHRKSAGVMPDSPFQKSPRRRDRRRPRLRSGRADTDRGHALSS